MADLVVQVWHTECGACRYGRGDWASPPRQGQPRLTLASRTCPRCGAVFTRRVDWYRGDGATDLTTIPDRAA